MYLERHLVRTCFIHSAPFSQSSMVRAMTRNVASPLSWKDKQIRDLPARSCGQKRLHLCPPIDNLSRQLTWLSLAAGKNSDALWGDAGGAKLSRTMDSSSNASHPYDQ